MPFNLKLITCSTKTLAIPAVLVNSVGVLCDVPPNSHLDY